LFPSLAYAAPDQSVPDTLEPVSIQFKWFNQFQFAGYYAAVEKGFYAEEGFSVTLKERNPQRDHIQSVLDGDAEYGVADSGLLLARMQGKPVVLLKQIFQRSPLVLMTRRESGITSPFDMRGKRIMLDSEGRSDAPIIAMLDDALGGIDQVSLVPQSFSLDEFITGKVDALSGYITNQPYTLRQQGVEVNIIDPRDYGINFYGDNFFTTEKEIKNHPDRVRRMIRATTKGWQYALDHPDEIIDLILKKYNQSLTRGKLVYEARLTEGLILPQKVPLGTVLPQRYVSIARAYKRAGLAPADGDWTGFIYGQEVQVAEKPAQPPLKLSAEERAWLEAHPRIRIGIMDAWEPLDFVDAVGKPNGIGVDYIKAINKRLGNRLEIVPAPFKENYEKVRNRQLDAIMDITPKKEREQYFNFTRAYLTIPHVYVGRKDGPFYGSARDLFGHTIALEKGYYNVRLFRKNYPQVTVREYPSTVAALEAVSRGEADAYAGNRAVVTYLIEKRLLLNLMVQGPMEKDPVSLNIGVRKDWPILAEILDRVLADITPEEEHRIFRRWTGGEKSGARKLELTAEENAWLKEHPVIRVHNEENWPPFNFARDGRPQGLSIEYMNLLAERLGITVEYVTGPSWNEFLGMLKDKKLDVMLNIVKTKERQKYILFTPTYFRNPNVIVSLENGVQYDNAEQLNGKTVAIPKGFYTEEILRNKFPEIKILPVKDVLECLKAIIQGKADASIAEVSVAQDIIARNMLTGLRLSGELNFGNPELANLHIGVRDDWPVLQSVLIKAMASVTPAEMNRIRQKWLIEAGPENYQVVLTAEERRWLADHPKIVVGGEMDWPPFDFVKDKRVTGYSNELLRLAARKAGMPLEFVSGYTWAQLLDMFQNKEIDILPAVYRTPERERFMDFTQSYITNPSVLVTHEDSQDIRTLKDLAGKKVAVVEAFATAQVMKERYPEIEQVPVVNVLEGLKAVSLKKVDAFIGSLGVISHHLKTNVIPYVRIVDEVWLKNPDETRLHMATLKEREILRDILQKGLDAVTVTEKIALRNEWLVETTYSKDKKEEKQKIKLTPRESYFITTHGPLVFSEVPWEPLSIIRENDQFDGVIADYLNFITEKSGLEFRFVTSDSWADVLEKYAKGEIDVIPALAKDDKVGREILVSAPYVTFPLVIVTHSDVNYISNTSELNGKKVAVGKGYTSFQYLHDSYPEINLVEVDDVGQGLIMLSNGGVFAFVGHLAVAVNHIQRLGLTNLKISGETGFKFDHRIGVDPKYPEAVSIINKVLASMTEKEHQGIYQKWLGVKYEKSIDYGLIKKILLVAAIILAVILYWNHKLTREIDGRRKAEERFQAMAANVPGAIFQMSIYPDGNPNFHYVSKSSNEFFGLPAEELTSGTRKLVLREDDNKRFRQALKNAAANEKNIEFTGRMPDIDNKQKWIRIVANPLKTRDDKVIFNGLMLDITNRKLAEQEHLASERKIKAMSHAVEDALVMINANDKVMFWNPAAEKLFGYTAEEAMGIDFHIMSVTETDLEKARAGMDHFRKTGEGPVIGTTIETMARNRAGKQFPVEVTVSSFQIDDEWFAVGTVRDITIRKNAEEDMKQNLDALERFSKVVIGREKKMIELKKEINQLFEKAGKEEKYKIVSDEQQKEDQDA